MKYEKRKISSLPNHSADTEGGIWNDLTNTKLPGALDRDGYIRHCISLGGGKRKNILAHRMVAQAFIENKKRCRLVCHNNGNPCDNRVKNLRWDNQKNNLADRYLHGTDFRGERNPSAKLSNKQVIAIKKLFQRSKPSQTEVAKKYGVSQPRISNILSGNSWRSIGV